MPTLEALRNRIDTARDMESVVAAMKVLAVVSIRQFEQSLGSLRESSRAIELGLMAAMMNLPRDLGLSGPPPGPRVWALVFGSEQGLSGQFNEQIVEFALDRLGELGAEQSRTVLAMGEHVEYRLRSAGVEASRVFSLPGSIARTGDAAREVLIHLGGPGESTFSAGEPGGWVPDFDQAVLFYHMPLAGASYSPRAQRLYPLDLAWLNGLGQQLWPARSRPVLNMDWGELFARLVREHIFISLQRVFAESLLSENASRLLAMQVAERNIGEYLDGLTHEFNNQRQSQITSELLDIVAGSEALFGGMEEEDYGLEYIP